jgi:hypothetical protein
MSKFASFGLVYSDEMVALNVSKNFEFFEVSKNKSSYECKRHWLHITFEACCCAGIP